MIIVFNVMEHAHELYNKAIKFVAQGGESNVLQSEIGVGKIYYTKNWKLKNKIDLVRNLKSVKNNTYKDLMGNKNSRNKD